MPFFPSSRPHALALGGLLGLALTLGGCGIVSGVKTPKTVDLRVTSAFGSRAVTTASTPALRGVTGAVSFTRQHTTVLNRGRGVTSIAGRRATSGTAWSLFINGIAASGANPELFNGDHVWWDLHDTSATTQIPAVVGSYPEPFTNGSGGRPYPTVLICADGLVGACDRVTHDLDHIGIKVSFQALGTGSGSDSLAVEVGTFAQLRGVIASELLSAGPAQSGVYARFAGPSGRVLELDNAAGSTTRTLVGSYGLIAATEEVGFSEPVWLITGTDRAGVDAAARALSVSNLANHFAVAVTPGGTILPVPVS